jgi:hypothetical protein
MPPRTPTVKEDYDTLSKLHYSKREKWFADEDISTFRVERLATYMTIKLSNKGSKYPRERLMLFILDVLKQKGNLTNLFSRHKEVEALQDRIPLMKKYSQG